MKPKKLYASIKKLLSNPDKNYIDLETMFSEKDGKSTYAFDHVDSKALKKVKDHLEGPIVKHIDLAVVSMGKVSIVEDDVNSCIVVSVFYSRKLRYKETIYKDHVETWDERYDT